MKKTLSLLLAAVLCFSCCITAFAKDNGKPVADVNALREQFLDGKGPETNGYEIDYAFFAPKKDGKKHPVVVWFHGMGQGKEKRTQITENDIPYWASDEFQNRFGGAHIIAPRSLEEKELFWSDSLIVPVKAAIDDYIEKNKDSVDVTRIYVGGFSMGGKMTFKMAVSYPDFFAAAFPICPAVDLSDEDIATLENMPIWLTVSKYDVIAGYYTFSKDIWERLCSVTAVPESCRLSLMGTVKFPGGKKCPSNHFAWNAVTYDMFTYTGGDYYNMTTTDATGREVKLTYPNGMISYLMQFKSDYNGEASLTPKVEFKEQPYGSEVERALKTIFRIVKFELKNIFESMFGAFKGEGDKPLETVKMTDLVENKGMKIVSHRGLSGQAPENTLAAFRLAGRAGAFGCEFDIHITKDGKWVVMHDDDVSRTTNGLGKIGCMTYERVRKLKIDAGHNVERYPNQKVPSLDEALDTIKRYDMVPVIEIKSGKDGDMAGLMKQIEAKADLSKVVIISFTQSYLKAIRELYPDVEIWLLESEISDGGIEFCKKNNAGMSFNYSNKGNTARIAELAQAGIVTVSWTVDDPTAAASLCESGVLRITSNRLIP